MSIYEYINEVRECDIPRMKRNKLEDLACDLLRSRELLEKKVNDLQGKLWAIINAVDDAQDCLPNTVIACKPAPEHCSGGQTNSDGAAR